MALLQNQFGLTTEVGTLVSGSNVQTVEFYSASPTDTIVAGEMVVLGATPSGAVPKASKGSALTDLFLGVVLTNILKSSWAVGERMEIGSATDVVYMTASAAITAGAKLQYDYATGKVATQTGTNTVIGMALEDAAGNASILRVYVQPLWLQAGETNTAANLGTAGEGEGLYATKTSAQLNFKRIAAGTGITLTAGTNAVAISTDGEANTVLSAGTAGEGVELVKAKTGVNIPIKRLKAGTGITLTEGTNGIEISLT